MSSRLSQIFTDHPARVGESYFQHMGVALSFAGTLAVAAGAALIHALIPALCEKTASNTICKLHDRMASRR